LLRTRKIDDNPAAKALVHLPEGNASISPGLTEALSVLLQGRSFYVPSRSASSAVGVVRRAFRFPHEPIDTDTAFEGLRFVNRVLKTARELHVLGPGAPERGGGGAAPGAFRLADAPAPGVALVAHPMLGGFFERSVVLVLDHNQRGSTGICLNMPLNVKLWALRRMSSHFVRELGRPSGAPAAADPSAGQGEGAELLSHFRHKWVSLGGPMASAEPGRYFSVLHGHSDLGGTCVMPPGAGAEGGGGAGVWVSQDVGGVMRRALKGGIDDDSLRLFAGMCRWAPRQLSEEVARGCWVMVRATPEALDVHEQQAAVAAQGERHGPEWCLGRRHDAWRQAMASLGGEFAAMATLPEDAVEAMWGDAG